MRERSRTLLDPLSLRLFAAVARYGSIAEAGRQEDMAASAVSKRLSDLEAAVGATLLERGTRGVGLTVAGEAVLHHAEDLQSLTDRLQADLDDIEGGRRGELRLAAATSALLGRLADDLARFAARYPDVHISLHEAPSLEAFDLIAGGAVDLAAVTDYEIPAKLERRRYEADPVWVVTPSDHPLVKGVPAGKPVRFQDALAYEVISAPTQGASGTLVMAAASTGDRPLRRRLRVRTFGALCRLVEAGLGIAFLRRSSAELHAKGLAIAARPLAEPWAQRDIALAYRSKDALPASARNFLALLEE